MNGLELHIEGKYLWPSGNFLDILSIVPASFDAYIFQQNTFPIYTQLKPRNSKTMLTAATIGVFFSFVAYMITGLLGLFMYGGDINDIILFYFKGDVEKFPGHKVLGAVCVVCILGFFVSALLGFPLIFLAMRNNFSSLIIFIKNKLTKKNEKDEPKKEAPEIETGLSLNHGIGFGLFTIALYVGVLLVAISVEKIIVLSKYSGVSCNNYITIMSPALFVLFLSKKWDSNKACALFVFIFGIGVMGAFIASEILNKA